MNGWGPGVKGTRIRSKDSAVEDWAPESLTDETFLTTYSSLGQFVYLFFFFFFSMLSLGELFVAYLTPLRKVWPQRYELLGLFHELVWVLTVVAEKDPLASR